jgi:DNA-binding response OmpR family regulator/GAF domain-containing protein
MSDKPRLLVIEREGRANAELRQGLTEHFEVVEAPTMARALPLIRSELFTAVVVETRQLGSVRWAGSLIQADEILEAIADGVAVVDPELKILWVNPEFRRLIAPDIEPVGTKFFRALASPELIDSDRNPFEEAAGTHQAASGLYRVEANRYLRLTVTPVLGPGGELCQLIALTHDATAQEMQKQKLDAIHRAGEELEDLTPEELNELGVEERIDLLKFNIVRHMKDLLGLDFIEFRLLDRTTGKLIPLVSVGMTHLAATRELYARREGNGVTGFVAATGKSYLCRDTSEDALYLEGASGARSSLTVPLLFHGTVIGTLNVENMQPNAFDDRDRQFLEIYGRSVASALNTLELLQVEKMVATTASVDAINRELALPIDDILNDATIVLDRYAGHDEDLIGRLRHLLYRAREIKSLVQKAGTTLASEGKPGTARAPLPLTGVRVLVVDSEEAIRQEAQRSLSQQGAEVETARDGMVAIAMARQTPYSVALADIRLPDLNGYEVYSRLREAQPGMPVILMTGFGYDPHHSIVKARKEGLQTVLYKPFRTDLMKTIEQTLRQSPGTADGKQSGRAGQDAAVPSGPDGRSKPLRANDGSGEPPGVAPAVLAQNTAPVRTQD